jgi:hypothetical protein
VFVVPLTVYPERKRAAVRVVIHGRPVRLLLDTGAAFSALDTQFANQIGLVPHRLAFVRGVTSEQVPARLATLTDLRIGRGPRMSAVVTVLDLGGWLSSPSNKAAGCPVVGILGADILLRSGAVIDLDRKVLTFRDWIARDHRLMQGDWHAVSLVVGGRPQETDKLAGMGVSISGTRIVMRTGRQDGVRVFAGTISLLPDAGVASYLVSDIELLDPPRPKPFRILNVRFIPDDAFRQFYGLYEIDGDMLRITLPGDRQKAELAAPAELASTPTNGVVVATYRRSQHPARPPLFTLLAALADLLGPHILPARINGWECTVTPDWTLTGVSAKQRLRFTARLDGSVVFQPVR